MKKNVKRINESQLRAIVAESVQKVLNEVKDTTMAKVKEEAYEAFKRVDKQGFHPQIKFKRNDDGYANIYVLSSNRKRNR